MLHELVASGECNMESLKEESMDTLKEICKFCSIPFAGKSKVSY